MTVPVALAGVSGILSVSGIFRKRCKTSPSSSLRSMPLSPFGTCVPPPPAGGVFPSRRGFGIPSRFPAKPNQFHRKRNLFANGSPARGAGASAPERASPVKLLQRRCDTMALTSRVRIAVCLALWQHPCPLRLLRRHLSQSERLWHSVTFFSKRKSVSSKTKPLCQGLP